MPSWLRNYTFQKIQEFYDKENEKVARANDNTQTLSKKTSIKVPDYTAKARK